MLARSVPPRHDHSPRRWWPHGWEVGLGRNRDTYSGWLCSRELDRRRTSLPRCDLHPLVHRHRHESDDSHRYRDALNRSRRRLLIRSDGSAVPAYCLQVSTVINACPFGTFGDEAIDVAAWRRFSASIVPDLLFDTIGLRAAVRETARALRMWLATYPRPAPGVWPNWTEACDIFSGSLLWALISTGLPSSVGSFRSGTLFCSWSPTQSRT